MFPDWPMTPLVPASWGLRRDATGQSCGVQVPPAAAMGRSFPLVKINDKNMSFGSWRGWHTASQQRVGHFCQGCSLLAQASAIVRRKARAFCGGWGDGPAGHMATRVPGLIRPSEYRCRCSVPRPETFQGVPPRGRARFSISGNSRFFQSWVEFPVPLPAGATNSLQGVGP